ncbi:MAG: hypothetical protein WC976_06690 [Caldisericia bacterium]
MNRKSVIGKYLWFSSNKKALMSMAEDILVKYGLLYAKVPQSDIARNNSFVLCIYDIGPKLKHELAKYSDDVILYRYWKSEADTNAKKYSSSF